MALAIDQGNLSFNSLHAAQLIKHALGLSRRHGSNGFVLLYLWYRVPGLAGDAHQAELFRFIDAIGDAVDFRAASYPEVISRISVGPPGWLEYIGHRYLLATEQLNQVRRTFALKARRLEYGHAHVAARG